MLQKLLTRRDNLKKATIKAIVKVVRKYGAKVDAVAPHPANYQLDMSGDGVRFNYNGRQGPVEVDVQLLIANQGTLSLFVDAGGAATDMIDTDDIGIDDLLNILSGLQVYKPSQKPDPVLDGEPAMYGK